MASASANCTCILCFRVIEKAHERYLVSRKTKFDLSEAIRQLPFPILETSLYICRQCGDKLRKRSSLVQQEKPLVNELKKYERGRLKRRQLFPEEGQESLITKRPCRLSEISPASSQTRATTPDKVYCTPPVRLLPTPISHSTPVKTKETSAPSNTSVNVKVRWSSQTRGRDLQPDLCSKKNPSILRSPSKERMLNFSFEEQRKESEERAPLFFSVLVAAGSTKTKTEEKAWIPAVMAWLHPYC